MIIVVLVNFSIMSLENERGGLEELNDSELGTKEFWDTHYNTEIDNFEDHGDVGDVWFGNSTLKSVINWFHEHGNVKCHEPIIDLGCGNGMTLVALAKLGYTNLTGVDYSQKGIDLAVAVMETEKVSGIKYHVADLLDEKCASTLGSFTVAFDKGTYDAISLSPNDSKMKRDLYKENVSRLITDSGYFIISSCNWTEKELVDFFSTHFTFQTSVPSLKQFQFGGTVGNSVTSVVFRPKST